MVCKCLDYFVFLSLACFVFLSLGQGKTLLVVCKCLDYDQSCIRYGHFTPRSQITLKIVWSRPWKLSPNKRQLHNINSNKYQSSGATTAPRPKLSDFATGNSLITSLLFISEVLTIIANPWVLQNLMCGPCVVCPYWGAENKSFQRPQLAMEVVNNFAWLIQDLGGVKVEIKSGPDN